MPNVSQSIEIAAPAERVWAIVGGFNALPVWLPPVLASRLSDDGRTRHLEIQGGLVVIEQLLEHSDAERRYSYTILEGPDPVTDYVATLSVERTGEASAKATWQSRFTPNDPQNAAQLVAQYEGLYALGLAHAKALAEDGEAA
ncbi:SRPBCC family protein [Burkholderia sp. Ac-20379]|uniref:SRPBCC family protein n=1 Tax=Burkholderia sp. Ac-20379 TaxID=2703900 RepID=UPI0019823E18|nr:SRPBCC family protein [Burkholderia sp. Ac-20379]MBN3726206.1 SRPBCC family protein [Burkholderia sp. Ac-20379]